MADEVELEYATIIVECNNPKMVGHRSIVTEHFARLNYGVSAEEYARKQLAGLMEMPGVKAALEYRQVITSRSDWQYVTGLDD